MGAKKVGNKGHESGKMKTEVDTMEEISPLKSSVMNANENFTSSGGHPKTKNKRHNKSCGDDVEISDVEVSDEAVNLKDNVGLNDNEMEKNEKKKRKRKLEQTNNEKESQKARKVDKVSDNSGEDKGVEMSEQMDMVYNLSVEERKDGETNQKKKKKKERTDIASSVANIPEDNRKERVVEGWIGPENEEIARSNDGKEDKKKKKKEKKKKKIQEMFEDGGHVELIKDVIDVKELESGREHFDENSEDQIGSTKKERNKKKKKHDVDIEAASPEIMADKQHGGDGGNIGGQQVNDFDAEGGNEDAKKKKKKKKKWKREKHDSDVELSKESNDLGESEVNTCSTKIKGGDAKTKEHAVSAGDGKKTKKEKEVSLENGSERKDSKRAKKPKKGAQTSNPSEEPSPKRTSKRVSFAENVEVFSAPSSSNGDNTAEDDNLVRGKRFSLEEDEMVKMAVVDYIDKHGLGEEGLKMVLNCRKHPEVRNCWKEIGSALPWRPCESVYHRAHILFERSEDHVWSKEELELVRKFHEKHGSDWKTLADALGKHRFHVKDAWRRIKLPNMKKGHWSQDEYQALFDLVNVDLRMKAFEERKSKHGMLRDNICWTAISDKLQTRTNAICCRKWYEQLTSPMVIVGEWLDTDDYLLVSELYGIDACCMEDVDWDNLLEHRSGDVCRKRWNQMVKHLGVHGNKSFADQVDILMQRYCPDVLEAREAYQSKPLVP